MKLQIRRILASAAGLLLVQPAILCLFYAGRLSDKYYVRPGETLDFPASIPVTADSTDSAVQANAQADTQRSATLRLFGIFPIKTAEIQETETIMLVPGGDAFGVRMLMDGIMVVDFDNVPGTDGCCPGKEAGLCIGDVIQEVNHVPVHSTDEFRQLAQGQDEVQLSVLRGDTMHELTLTPVYSATANAYRTGLWVRDSAAGIGTLTYYDPATGDFGGLGHPICDADTGELIPLGSGEADPVSIQGAVRGQPGTPGQLQGYFSAEEAIGTLDTNCHCGIFGTLYEAPDAQAIPMAFKQEVTLGEAVILSTVNGDEPEAFSIEITSIDYTAGTQQMTIRVTDEDLIAATGGIVQGMSGSPILQDGKLAGAVTHVFVSDPSQGYAIFAETMYDASNMPIR